MSLEFARRPSLGSLAKKSADRSGSGWVRPFAIVGAQIRAADRRKDVRVAARKGGDHNGKVVVRLDDRVDEVLRLARAHVVAHRDTVAQAHKGVCE